MGADFRQRDSVLNPRSGICPFSWEIVVAESLGVYGRDSRLVVLGTYETPSLSKN